MSNYFFCTLLQCCLASALWSNSHIQYVQALQAPQQLNKINQAMIKDKLIELKYHFWIKMFSQISSNETLIHDQENASLVYLHLNHQGFNHTQRVALVEQQLKLVRNALLKKSLQLSQQKKLKLTAAEQKVISNIPSFYINPVYLKFLSQQVRYQQGMKEKFSEGIERSKVFMPMILETLKQKNLPEELAYLPHVESSFQYEAWSKVGAAGIWQLMPKTAKAYGLTVTDAVDERLDPIRATEAASQLLKDYAKSLRYSWPLVITAYNNGPALILKRLKALKTKETPAAPLDILRSLQSDHFQFASSNFYPSYLAAVQLAKEQTLPFQRFYQEHPAYKVIYLKPKEKMSLGLFLKRHRISFYEFKKHNLHLRNDFYLKAGLNAKMIKQFVTQSKKQNELTGKEKISFRQQFIKISNLTLPSNINLYVPNEQTLPIIGFI